MTHQNWTLKVKNSQDMVGSGVENHQKLLEVINGRSLTLILLLIIQILIFLIAK